jgi:SAM-dependent methyltransferase
MNKIGFLAQIAHAKQRRRALKQRFNIPRQMAELEETCIPSYLHPNLAAAGVAWLRLFAAAQMYQRYAPQGPILDFGAASGELAHLLSPAVVYEFIEVDEAMAEALTKENTRSQRRQLEWLEVGRYAAIFALDSLEHNDNFGFLLRQLVPALRSDGVLIISGPTENWLYRLGRRIAGFSGEYHHTTIYDIERVAGEMLFRLKRRMLPIGVPLFSISCWSPICAINA